MLFYTYFHITDSRLSILGGQGNGRQGGENGRVKSENQFESNAGLRFQCSKPCQDMLTPKKTKKTDVERGGQA